MPILNSCCICFTTRTGSFILGLISLIVSILGTLGCILTLAFWGSLTETIRKEYPHEAEELITFFRVFVIVGLVFLLLDILITALLIHGIRKMRPSLMLPYIILGAISLVIYVIMNIVGMAKGQGLISGIISILITLIFGIYFLLVVVSHYQELRDRDGRASVPTDSKF